MKKITFVILLLITILLIQGCFTSINIDKDDIKKSETISKESAIDYLNELPRPKGDLSCTSFNEDGTGAKSWDKPLVYSEGKIISLYIYEQYRVAIKWEDSDKFCDLHWTKNIEEVKETISSLIALGVQFDHKE